MRPCCIHICHENRHFGTENDIDSEVMLQGIRWTKDKNRTSFNQHEKDVNA
jgi:hypothetical protein